MVNRAAEAEVTRVAGTCRLDHSAAEAGRVVNRAAEAEVTRVAGTCRLDHSAAEAGRGVNRAAKAEVTRVTGDMPAETTLPRRQAEW